MILSQVTVDWDLSFGVEALVCLFVIGGAMLLLSTLLWGDNPVSSGLALPKRFGPRHDSLDPIDSAAGSAGRKRACRGRDKRRSLRRGGNPVPILISQALDSGVPLQGLVLNRSRGGLFLSVPQSIEVGRLLTVRTPDFPKMVASVNLRVRHSKQRGEAWRIGCQFVDELPWSVLLLFG